jgi:hypothetical protein
MERIEGPSLRPRLDAAPLALDEVIEIGIARGHRAARPAPPAPGAPGRQAQQHHVPRRRHGGAGRLRPVAPRPPARPAGRGIRSCPWAPGPYMSPEQVQFVRNDPRSDLFALGVMLYHFTTGERPLRLSPRQRARPAPAPVLDPVPPRALRADCPPWLQEVILQVPGGQARARYQSAAQLALALQQPDPGGAHRARRAHAAAAAGALKRWFFAFGAEPVAAAQLGQPSSSIAAPSCWPPSTSTNAAPGLLDSCARPCAASC